MARTDRLDELTSAEQEALKVVARRLLQADPQSSASAMSHITLLWLDWVDRWEGHVSDPLPLRAVSTDEPARHIDLDGTGLDAETARALMVLATSHCRLVICEFLFELARTNGINQSEARFLAIVRNQLTSVGQRGPYR